MKTFKKNKTTKRISSSFKKKFLEVGSKNKTSLGNKLITKASDEHKKYINILKKTLDKVKFIEFENSKIQDELNKLEKLSEKFVRNKDYEDNLFNIVKKERENNKKNGIKITTPRLDYAIKEYYKQQEKANNIYRDYSEYKQSFESKLNKLLELKGHPKITIDLYGYPIQNTEQLSPEEIKLVELPKESESNTEIKEKIKDNEPKTKKTQSYRNLIMTYPKTTLNIGLATATTLYLKGPSLYKWLSKASNSDLLKEIEHNPSLFNSINDKLKEDEKFILKAIEKNKEVWNYIETKIKKDVKFCIKALDINAEIWEKLSNKIKINIVEILETPEYKKEKNKLLKNDYLKFQIEEFVNNLTNKN